MFKLLLRVFAKSALGCNCCFSKAYGNHTKTSKYYKMYYKDIDKSQTILHNNFLTSQISLAFLDPSWGYHTVSQSVEVLVSQAPLPPILNVEYVLNGKSLILSEDDIYVRSWTFVVPPPSLSLDATVIIDNRWQS